MGLRIPLEDEIQDQLDAADDVFALEVDGYEIPVNDLWMVVLVHRDGDCKTCLGATPEEASDRAKQVAYSHRVYVAAFLPVLVGTIPTSEAKKLAEGVTTWYTNVK